MMYANVDACVGADVGTETACAYSLRSRCIQSDLLSIRTCADPAANEQRQLRQETCDVLTHVHQESSGDCRWRADGTPSVAQRRRHSGSHHIQMPSRAAPARVPANVPNDGDGNADSGGDVKQSQKTNATEVVVNSTGVDTGADAKWYNPNRRQTQLATCVLVGRRHCCECDGDRECDGGHEVPAPRRTKAHRAPLPRKASGALATRLISAERAATDLHALAGLDGTGQRALD